MNGCFGCFALMVLLVVGVMVVQVIAVNWAPILGISLSYASLRYIKAHSAYQDD